MSGKNDGGASGSGAVKKPIYKKWWFWVIIVFVALAVLSPKNGTAKKAADAGSEATAPPASTPASVSNSAPPVSSSISEVPVSEPVADEKAEAQETLKAALSSGVVSFEENVRNDTTGRWRLLLYSSGESILPHAADYYRAFFASDDEVHCVVNLGLKTTTVLTVSSGALFVSVHEYTDGEEHDAKALAGGMVLASYMVNLTTGEIDDLSVVENQTEETVSLRGIETSIESALPQEYLSRWSWISCDSNLDQSVFVSMQIDVGDVDSEAALSAVVKCFEISKAVVDNTGASFGSFNAIAVNDGSPIGIYGSEDGKTFTLIVDGKRTEITVP